MISVFLFIIHQNSVAAAAVAKSLQSCPTLCDPIDGSPPGSPIPGILQARRLECYKLLTLVLSLKFKPRDGDK